MNEKLFYVSVFLSFIAALLFLLIIFALFLFPFNILGLLICLFVLFSESGEKILKKSVNYIRVLTVGAFAIICSGLVGLTISANIADYYDDKIARVAPAWLGTLNTCIFLVSVIIGIVLSGVIFKKYYKFENTCSEQNADDTEQ